MAKKLKNATIFLRPSFIVLLFYLSYTTANLSMNNYDPTTFLYVGKTFLEKDPQSPITRYVIETMGLPPNEVGYDGQMYYYIALDPFNAWRNLDTYGRYERILFPLTVKAVALDNSFLIPYTMIAVNILSVVIGTEVITKMLKSKRINPWFSLVYGLYIGHVFVISRDCLETFSYMFVLLAIYVFEEKKEPVISAFFFVLALFAKETAILFVVGYAFGMIFKKVSLKDKIKFLMITIVPYALFQMTLYNLFGFIPLITVGSPTFTRWVPFYGVFEASSGGPEFLNIAFLIIIPSIISCLIFIAHFLKKEFNGTLFSLILNVLFMMFLPTPSYWNLQDYSRISIGLVTAFLAYAICNTEKRILAYSLTWILPFSTYFTYA